MTQLTIADVIQAKRRISQFISRTPIVTSSILNNWLGHDVLFKAECLQRIGAFKARGACNFVTSLLEQGHAPKHIVANSSGNHAQAVAWSATRFGIASTIYMARTASSIKVQGTAAYGAKVVLCDTRAEADRQVEEASKQPNTWWVPPFDHDWIIAGQGTAVLEALWEVGEVDAMFAPCGGGGLLSGSLISARALSPKAQVVGVEPAVANDAAESLRTGTIQGLRAAPETLADGVMTPRVGEITFEYLKQLDGFFTVDEETIRYWTQWLNHLLKIRIEPTSALAMGGVTQWLLRQSSPKKVLVVLSGGNIDQAKMLKLWQQDCLAEIPRLKR
jgi:threo-3-hydroxy-L-aspartate ammonia-lyase